MIRTRHRKTIEELYGTKFDATKSQVAGQQGESTQKNIRDYGYIITSNAPYSGPVAPSSRTGNSGQTKNLNTCRGERRKSARPSNKPATERPLKEENPAFPADDIKREHTLKMKVNTRNEKPACCKAPAATPIMYDNKAFVGNYKDIPMEGNTHHHHHHTHRHNAGHDDDKDDDTDEFFQLIRHTVENAIGKSISELLNRNFRELSSKVDRFSAELHNTNALLNQMQMDMNNKIVHFGEENSRHFRYLCMKSEYDKMFYQQQQMAASAATTTPNVSGVTTSNTETKKPEKPKSNPKMQRNDCVKSKSITNCQRRSANYKVPPMEVKDTNKQSSEDVSQKSSDVGMREVLEHIQKFCNQMQMNEMNSNGPGTSHKREVFRPEDIFKINKEVFNEEDDEDEVEDEDELELSSDGMTPRCEPNDNHTYGGTTQRGCISSRASNGGGDA